MNYVPVTLIYSHHILTSFVILVPIRCTPTWNLFVKLFTEIKIYIAVYITIIQDTFNFFASFALFMKSCKGGKRKNENGLFRKTELSRLNRMFVKVCSCGFNCKNTFIISYRQN